MTEVRPIDANALKKAIADAFYNLREIAYISDIIERQPTIEPEVRHGRWVVNDRNPDYADCTNCGLSEWIGANGSREYAETLLPGFKKFCPNCGARMDADHIADASKKVGGAEK